jgi:hypothetical protein
MSPAKLQNHEDLDGRIFMLMKSKEPGVINNIMLIAAYEPG